MTTTEKARPGQTGTGTGRVVRVTGPVVDVEFSRESMPELYNALHVDVELGGVSPDPWGNTRAGFSATGKISRKDFNMPFNMGGVIGDEVEILLAEVGATPAEDKLYHITYDGTVMDEEGSTVLGGRAETLAEGLGTRFQQGMAADQARLPLWSCRASIRALGHRTRC